MSASDEPAKELDEPVEIEVWNPAWPRLARSLIAELAEHLCPECRIEHIGSTALEGMPAKPVIDLMVGVKDEAEQDACARLLSSAATPHVAVSAPPADWSIGGQPASTVRQQEIAARQTPA